jgi:hypothetical protein
MNSSKISFPTDRPFPGSAYTELPFPSAAVKGGRTKKAPVGCWLGICIFRAQLQLPSFTNFAAMSAIPPD